MAIVVIFRRCAILEPPAIDISMPEKAVLAGQKGQLPGRFMSAPTSWIFAPTYLGFVPCLLAVGDIFLVSLGEVMRQISKIT